MRIFFIIFIFACIYGKTNAQESSDTLLLHYVEQAKGHIDLGHYEEAQKSWVKVFGLNQTLPDEVAYFYGLTQFKLGKHAASISALKKYIELTGWRSPYNREAHEIIYQASCALNGFYEENEICDNCEGSGKEVLTCRTCKGKGKNYCSVCSGSGVSKEQQSMGNTYHSCSKCEGTGIVECFKCHGEGTHAVNCMSCNGKGIFKAKVQCRD